MTPIPLKVKKIRMRKIAAPQKAQNHSEAVQRITGDYTPVAAQLTIFCTRSFPIPQRAAVTRKDRVS